ncbi:unnamed protein product [Pylaiella littoralis]
MGLMSLSFLLHLVHLPVLSFVQLPLRVLVSGRYGETFGSEPCISVLRQGCRCTSPTGPPVATLLWHRCRSRPAASTRASRAIPRRRTRSHGERASEDGTTTAVASGKLSNPTHPRPAFLPSEAVSCLQNPDTSSTIWLVGIMHETRPYVQLVKRVIREIRPQVVMLELDVESTFLLPPGEAHSQNGLWWWKPEGGQLEGEANRTATKKAIGRTRTKQNFGKDSGAEASEVCTAVQEAQACGARVLLGDRSDKESKRREAEADRADSEMLKRVSEDSGTTVRRRLERAGKGLQMLIALIERRRAYGFEMPETRAIIRKHSEWYSLLGPRAFDVVVTERDEVMTHNLLALEGTHVTVAVVGSAHLDGMENILLANGWVESISASPPPTSTTC